jgi:ATP-binding cassette subfamily B protein
MNIILRLLRFSAKYWPWMVLGFVGILFSTALSLATPQFIRIIIDKGIGQKNYRLIPYYALSIVGVTLVRGIFAFLQNYSSEYAANRTVYDVRNRLFDHIQHLSFTYHDEAETGQLISRATADADALRSFLGMGLLNLFANAVMVAGITVVLLTMNRSLALITIATLPFLVAVALTYRERVRPLFISVQDQIGRLTIAIQQNLMGIRVVKSFAAEDYETAKFSGEANDLLSRNLAAARTSNFFGPLMDFITAIGTTFILWYGGRQVVEGRLTLGEFVAFITYLMMIFWPVRILVWVVGVAQSAVAAGDRIFEILDTHPEAHLRDGTVELTDCKGHVEFKDVSFRYDGGGIVLRNINLDVQPKEMVAFIGPTGSGKSTIINLIPRFYDVTEGAVLIDGLDIKEYRLESLRRQIGIVSQETFLFSDTVHGNIAYGRPGAPMGMVVEAAKTANIHDFILTLPKGYETRVGERGVNLSGGQKQRIAIARALLMDPPILIMDDSTSSVDTETESLIQEALESLTKSRTTFVIAGRISTVKRADRIVVLDKGRIVEMGTHKELLMQGRLYSQIYRMQFGGREEQGNGAAGI